MGTHGTTHTTKSTASGMSNTSNSSTGSRKLRMRGGQKAFEAGDRAGRGEEKPLTLAVVPQAGEKCEIIGEDEEEEEAPVKQRLREPSPVWEAHPFGVEEERE